MSRHHTQSHKAAEAMLRHWIKNVATSDERSGIPISMSRHQLSNVMTLAKQSSYDISGTMSQH